MSKIEDAAKVFKVLPFVILILSNSIKLISFLPLWF